jgi:BTB/POZ domain
METNFSLKYVFNTGADGDTIFSPVFEIPDLQKVKWKLVLTKGSGGIGGVEPAKYFSLSLCLLRRKGLYLNKYNIGIMSKSGEIVHEIERIRQYFHGSLNFAQNRNKFPVEILQDKALCQDNELTVVVSFNRFQVKSSSKQYIGNDLRDEFCDATLFAHGQGISVHRIVLAAASDVFRTLFTSEFSEKDTCEIEIADFGFIVVLQMVRFLYSGQLPGYGHDVSDLLLIADKYNIGDLRKACIARLLVSFNCTTVRGIIEVASLVREDNLKRAAVDYMLDNIKDFSSDGNESIVCEVMEGIKRRRISPSVD